VQQELTLRGAPGESPRCLKTETATGFCNVVLLKELDYIPKNKFVS